MLVAEPDRVVVGDALTLWAEDAGYGGEAELDA
jgi:hypothetical protein